MKYDSHLKKNLIIVILFLCCFSSAMAQIPYQQPDKVVVDILTAPQSPLVRISPDRKAIAFVDWTLHPPVSFLAKPYLKLAGLRIDPENNSLHRSTLRNSMWVKFLEDNRNVSIKIPKNSETGMPCWSFDGAKIAFMNYKDDGVELVFASPKTGDIRAVDGIRLNHTTDEPYSWTPGSRNLLVKMIPGNRGKASKKSLVPTGPVVEESSGKFSQMRTYQDLLKTPYDDELFEYYCTSQLALVDSETLEVRPVGKPGIFLSAEYSPDGKYILVMKLKKPYSHRVPYYFFARSIEIWDNEGNIVRTVADLPASEEVARFGVETGPRSISWQPLFDAKLVWLEALDGGDPMRDVPYHDSVMSLSAPFKNKAVEVLKIRQRFTGFSWLQEKNTVLIGEYERKRRWYTLRYYNLQDPIKSERTIFDLSAKDDYNDPGDPVEVENSKGETIVLQDGDSIYLKGKGASKKGDMPFLDKMNLKTLKKVRLFQSKDNCYEIFYCFAGNSREKILTRYETATKPPNYFIFNLKTKARTALTDFSDPAEKLGIRQEIVKYVRQDGVPLSGTLYLPPTYKKGEKLPLILWAYPLEYSDPKTAGQVRGSPNRFTSLWGAQPVFFLVKGYAVFRAQMPVVGDPETVNDTFIKQIVADAKAAIDKLDTMGLIDRKKVLVGGHSYGAFMVAHLLANCDLFAAGIARSGAYNRTLTPFGFQSERRTLWEAPEFYLKISPITAAHKIKAPLLIIHGMEDDNSGTYPMQSERLFDAIKGNGGTARLLLLPNEKHSYYSRESNLHVLKEMFDWADRFLKGEDKTIEDGK